MEERIIPGYDQYKKYITKAQKAKLVEGQQRFNNQLADERVNAMGQMRSDIDQQRAYLQNRGLAGNGAPFHSGAEAYAVQQNQAAFRGYNQQLQGVKDAQTEQLAAKFANDTRRARARASAQQQFTEYLDKLTNADRDEMMNGTGDEAKAFQAQVKKALGKKGMDTLRGQTYTSRTSAENVMNYMGGLSQKELASLDTDPAMAGIRQEIIDSVGMENYELMKGYYAKPKQQSTASMGYGLSFDAKSAISRLASMGTTGNQGRMEQDIANRMNATLSAFNGNPALSMPVQQLGMVAVADRAERAAAIAPVYDLDAYRGQWLDENYNYSQNEARIQELNGNLENAGTFVENAQRLVDHYTTLSKTRQLTMDEWEQMQQASYYVKNSGKIAEEWGKQIAALERKQAKAEEAWGGVKTFFTETMPRYAQYDLQEVQDIISQRKAAGDTAGADEASRVYAQMLRDSTAGWTQEAMNGGNTTAGHAYHGEPEDYTFENNTGSHYYNVVNDNKVLLWWNEQANRALLKQTQDAVSTIGDMSDGAVLFETLFGSVKGMAEGKGAAAGIAEMTDTAWTEEEFKAWQHMNDQEVFLAEYAEGMTKEQVATFNYVYNTYGPVEADRYFESIFAELDAKVANNVSDSAAEMVAGHPILGTLVSTPLNFTLSAVSPLTSARASMLTPEGYGGSKGQAAKNNYAQLMRAGVQKDTKMGAEGSFYYGVATSMLDSWFAAGLSGNAFNGGPGANVGGTMLGMSAFNSAYQNNVERGLSDPKAYASAAVSGAIEMLTEKYSIEALLKTHEAKLFSPDFFLNLAKQGGSEMSEELASGICNDVADILINGNQAEMIQKYHSLLDSGDYGESQAFWKVIGDEAKEVGMESVAGLLSGVLSGAGATMVQNFSTWLNGGKTTAQYAKEGKDIRINAEQMEKLSAHEFTSEIGQDLMENAGSVEKASDAELARMNEVMQMEEAASDAVAGVKAQEGAMEALRAYEYRSPEAQVVAQKETLSDSDIAYLAQERINQEMQDAAQALSSNQEAMKTYPVFTKIANGQAITMEEAQQIASNDGAMAFFTQKYGAAQGADGVMQNATMAARKVQQTFGTLKDAQVSGTTARKAERIFRDASTITADTKTQDFKTRNGSVRLAMKTGDTRYLSSQAKAAIGLSIAAANATGANIVVRDTFRTSDNQRLKDTPRGRYDKDTNTIEIALDSDQSVAYVLGHELVHYMEHYAGEGYAIFKDIVFNALDKVDVSKLDADLQRSIQAAREQNPEMSISEAMVAYENKRQGGKLSKPKAEGEVLAEAGSAMLLQKSVQKEIARLNNATVAERIVEFANKMGEEIKKLLGEKDFTGEEYNMLKGQADTMRKMEAAYRAMLMEANLNAKKQMEQEERDEAFHGGIVTADDGTPVISSDGNGAYQNSLRYYREAYTQDGKSGRDVLEEYLNKSGVDQEQRAEILEEMDRIYRACMELKDRFEPFGKWSEAKIVKDDKGKPVFSVVTPNGEYKLNLDFSLVCKKRRSLNTVLNRLCETGVINTVNLGQEEIVRINQMIKEHGFETACALCFVDAKRYRQAKVADDFVEIWNGLVKSLVPSGKNLAIDSFEFAKDHTAKHTDSGIDKMSTADLDTSRLKQTMKEYGKGTVEHKVAKYLLNNPSKRRLCVRGDFMSTAGFDAVKTREPQILKLYNAKKGTGGPKAAFSDVQYMNEVIAKGSFTPAKAFAMGGVRIQSFSDFVASMVFDYVQMFGDLAAKQLPAQVYTKEDAFVKLFGLTGAKINMSLIPKVVENGMAPGLDVNGEFVFADESFDFETAKKIQSDPAYGKNCGTICVGVSDMHIRKLLEDPDIRMVIPYHKSGLNSIVAHMHNIHLFEDYTKEQKTTHADGSALTDAEKKNHFNFNQYMQDHPEITSAKQVADAYLSWCDQNGFKPMFERFRDSANYYKLLEDFSLTDAEGNYSPQRAVQLKMPGIGSAFGSDIDIIRNALAAEQKTADKTNAEIDSLSDAITAMLKGEDTEDVQYSVRGKMTNLEKAESVLKKLQENNADEEIINQVESTINDIKAKGDAYANALYQTRHEQMDANQRALEMAEIDFDSTRLNVVDEERESLIQQAVAELKGENVKTENAATKKKGEPYRKVVVDERNGTEVRGMEGPYQNDAVADGGTFVREYTDNAPEVHVPETWVDLYTDNKPTVYHEDTRVYFSDGDGTRSAMEQNVEQNVREVTEEIIEPFADLNHEDWKRIIAQTRNANFLKQMPVERVLDAICGKNAELRQKMYELIEKPFNEAGGKFARSREEMFSKYTKAMDDLGIKTREQSAAIQRIGEHSYQHKCTVQAWETGNSQYHVRVVDPEQLDIKKQTVTDGQRTFAIEDGRIPIAFRVSDGEGNMVDVAFTMHTENGKQSITLHHNVTGETELFTAGQEAVKEYDMTFRDVMAAFQGYGKTIASKAAKYGMAKNSPHAMTDSAYAPYTLDMLQKDHPDDWQNILDAERISRQMYDDYVDSINKMLEEVYPMVYEKDEQTIEQLQAKVDEAREDSANQRELISRIRYAIEQGQATIAMMDNTTQEYADAQHSLAVVEQRLKDATKKMAKLTKKAELREAKLTEYQAMVASGETLRNKRLQKRSDYYHHFQEMTDNVVVNLRNILKTNTDIDPQLVNISDQTKPKSKWTEFLQQRVGGAYTEDAVNGMYKYIAGAEYILAYDPLISRFREIQKRYDSNTREMKGSSDTIMNSKNANNFMRWMNAWVNNIAGKTHDIDRVISNEMGDRRGLKFIQKLNGLGKSAKLLFNVRSALVQVSNMTNAAMYVDAVDWKNGWFNCLNAMKGKEMAEILSKSNFVSQRLAEVPVFEEATLKTKAMNFANRMLSAGDSFSTQMTWWAAYNQYERIGAEAADAKGYRHYEDAIDYADDITRRTHGGRGVGELPVTLQSRLVNLFAPFQVEVLNTFENLVQVIGKKDALGIAKMQCSIFAFNMVTRCIFGDGVLGFDFIHALMSILKDVFFPEDKEEKLQDHLKYAGQQLLGELISGVPFAAQAATFLVPDENAREKMFGDSDPTRYGTGTIGLSFIAEMVNIFNDLTEGKNVAWDLLDATVGNYMTGGSQIMRTAKGLYTWVSGYSTDKKGNVQFAIDQDATELVLMAIFGKWAVPEAREYLGSLDPIADAGYKRKAPNGKKPGITSDNQNAGYKEYVKAGGNGKDFIKMVKQCSMAEGQKDANGKTISGSVKQAKLDIINGYGLSASLKNIVLQALNIKE